MHVYKYKKKNIKFFVYLKMMKILHFCKYIFSFTSCIKTQRPTKTSPFTDWGIGDSTFGNHN